MTALNENGAVPAQDDATALTSSVGVADAVERLRADLNVGEDVIWGDDDALYFRPDADAEARAYEPRYWSAPGALEIMQGGFAKALGLDVAEAVEETSPAVVSPEPPTSSALVELDIETIEAITPQVGKRDITKFFLRRTDDDQIVFYARSTVDLFEAGRCPLSTLQDSKKKPWVDAFVQQAVARVEVRIKQEQREARDKRKAEREERRSREARKWVVLNNADLRDVVGDVVGALVERRAGVDVFTRGDSIVKMADSELHKVERGGLILMIHDECAITEVRETSDGEEIDTPALLTGQHHGAIEADLFEKAPKILRVTHTPFMRPDWSACLESGFDASTGTYLLPSVELKNVGFELAQVNADGRTPQQRAEAARNFLVTEMLSDFHYVEESDRANALATILTPFIRAMVPLVPGAAVEANDKDAGKGLFVDICHLLWEGRTASPRNWIGGEVEMGKYLTSKMLEAPSTIVFDEAHNLRSNELTAFLTSNIYEGRVLGKSEVVNIPNQTFLMVIGKNIAFHGDLDRRFFKVRQRAVADGHKFRHADLRGWVRANRHRLLAAVLTILQAYGAEEAKPEWDGKVLGSFEAWSRLLGSILTYCGQPDFLGGFDDQRAEADMEGDAWARHFSFLYGATKGQPFTAADATERLRGWSITGAAVSDIEAPGIEVRGSKVKLHDETYAKALGTAYRTIVGARPRGGFVLQNGGKSGRTRSNLYYVEAVDPKAGERALATFSPEAVDVFGRSL